MQLISSISARMVVGCAIALGSGFPLSADARVYFNSSFDESLYGDGVGNYTETVGPNSAHNIKWDSTVFRAGIGSARIYCDDKDVDSGGDLSARDELSGQTDLKNGLPLRNDENSGVRFYAVSYRLSPDWHVVTPDPAPGSSAHLHNTILQMKKSPSSLAVPTSPAFDLDAIDQFRVHIRGGPADDRSFAEYECSLANGKLHVGHWVDFVIRIKFDYHPNGQVTIWRRNELDHGGFGPFKMVLDKANVANLFYLRSHDVQNREIDTIITNYWKQGSYRTPHQAGLDKTAPDYWPKVGATATLFWTDGLTQADTFKQAVDHAFKEDYRGTIEPPAEIESDRGECIQCDKTNHPC